MRQPILIALVSLWSVSFTSLARGDAGHGASDEVVRFLGDGAFADLAIEVTGDATVLYLAMKPTNQPLGGAKVSLQSDGDELMRFTETKSTGVYRTATKARVAGGSQIIIESADDSDIIILQPAQVSPGRNAVTATPHTEWQGGHLPLIVGLVALGVGLFAGIFLGRSMRPGVVAIALGVFPMVSRPADAHGGHDHAEAPGGESGESGGGASLVQLSKKSQFLIGVRTMAATAGKLNEGLTAYGHIIAKPQLDAAILAPQPGFVRNVLGSSIGKQVRKGEVLARIEAVGSVAIVSPMDGQIIEAEAIEGSRVEAGAKLFRVTNTSAVWVDAELFEGDLTIARRATGATVTTGGSDRIHAARIVQATTPISEETRTAKVFIEIDNHDNDLRIGSFATINFSLPETTDAIAIPVAAVLNRGGEQIVFVQSGPEAFSPRTVLLRKSSQPGTVIIDNGLMDGDRVVVSGNYQLMMKVK